MTVNTLEQTMSPREFAGWRHYYLTEPFGSRTHHQMIAQLTALMFNVNRGKDTEPLTLHNFDLFEAKPEQEARHKAEEKAWRNKFLSSVETHNASMKKPLKD